MAAQSSSVPCPAAVASKARRHPPDPRLAHATPHDLTPDLAGGGNADQNICLVPYQPSCRTTGTGTITADTDRATITGTYNGA
jgi:hypothetical protein